MIKKYLIILCGCACLAACRSNVSVADLKCENLTDPLAIDNTAPHFSWKLAGAGAGEGQRYYRIQVSADSLFQKSSLWDSGKVRSAAQVMVPYGGSPLESRNVCYWRVMVWTGKGVSQWSPTARFGVGLMDGQDMQGAFIGYPDSGSVAPIFRESFSVNRSGNAALLYVNSLGYHEVYINGEKVGDAVLSPAVSQLDKRSLIVTYDAGPYLRTGENQIVIWLGSGWYKKTTFGKWEPDDPYAEPLVRAQLDIHHGGIRETVCRTDDAWEAALSGYSDTGAWKALRFGGEQVDARLNPADMRPETLDGMEWRNVAVREKPGHTASPQMCEPDKIQETLSPKAIHETAPGVWFVDMGKVVTGWFEMTFTGLSAGDVITIEYSDEIDGNGNLDDQRQKDSYIARGGDRETFKNKFNYHAFRYVKISGLPGKPDGGDIKSHLIHTDYAAASTFECSDADLNAIHDMVQYTMQCLTYGGYMVDCPHLERAGYGGDGNSSAETLQTMYAVAPLFQNWLQAWDDAMRPDGGLPHAAPNDGTNGGGPYWCGFMIAAPWQTYLNYGDRRLIEKYYGAMQRWLGYVGEYTVDGLLTRWQDTDYRDWFLGDWLAPEGVDTGNPASISLVNNCFISDCFGKMEKMAVLLGKPGDAQVYAGKKEQLNTLLHERFFNPEECTYATGSQLDMTYPMLVGVTPESVREDVVKRLFAYTESEMTGHIRGGLVGIPIITKWAVENRAADWMSGMLKKRDYPGYLYMIDNGATTTWEYWNGERSRVHNCYNGIGMWFYQAVGGLRTDESAPGYRHVFIDPQIPAGVTWSKVTKDTPYGTIELGWELGGEELNIAVSLPSGTTATLVVPENAAGCRIDGKKHSGKNGDIILASGYHEVIFFLQ